MIKWYNRFERNIFGFFAYRKDNAMQKSSYNVGIYCRLSRDDGKSESTSISNQREMLTKYVEEQGWNLSEVYIDDGFTGTNFERPDFQRMIVDVERGLINCVITKDLSRLGRNYSKVGYYTDEFFPLNNVRYIAINGEFDTENSDDGFSAFHNVINEFYPREVSKKVKAVYKMNAEKGLWIGGTPPYGYMKSPHNNKVLVIDEETAPIVKRIFEEFASGTSGRAIAENLTNEGILCPGAYYAQRLGKPCKTTAWSSSAVCSILDKEVYIGNLVQGKRKKVSFKSKERRFTPKETWITVENTHEAIISKEIFDEVRKLRQTNVVVRKPSGKRQQSIFHSQVKCSDCGAQMSPSLQANKITYRCGTYINKGKSVCTAHNIREEVLEAIVLNDITNYAKINKKQLVDEVLKLLKAETSGNHSYIKQKLSKMKSEIAKIEKAVENLYLDKANIPDTIFRKTMDSFNSQLEKLSADQAKLAEQLGTETEKQADVSKWADLVRQYANLDKLTRQIAHELIDSITVSAFYKVNGKNMQDVTINYKFVGNLSPTAEREEKIA